MISIEVHSNAAAVRARFEQAPARIRTAIAAAMQQVGLTLVSQVKLQALADQILHYRTRTLSRAIFSRVENDGQDRSAVFVGADLAKAPYARIQEYGGTIRPTHGQFLTIPVGVNLTANGVMRVSAREFLDNPTALGFATAFVNRQKTAIMGAARGAAAQPVFALKTQVTIPERSYLRSTAQARKAWIVQLFQQTVTKAAAGDSGDQGS